MARLATAALGAAMVLVCVLAAVISLSAVLLVVGEPGSSAALLSPEDSLLGALGGLFTVILVGIAIRYGYYYYCWLVSRHYFRTPPRIDVADLRTRRLPYLKFQVTTKGGALPVVERSLRVLEGICSTQPWLCELVSAEVITERAGETEHLNAAFAGSPLPVTALTLPPDYQTPNGSRLKARALHYMVEQRMAGFNVKPGITYIVHFDEETVMTEPHVLVLLDYLSKHPRPITQGPILYPLEWEQTSPICRAIESTRPFGCSECARVMTNPPPPHLHGSNLVVEESTENRVGWDFGTIDGQPFVAEDLLFGLRAYALLGDEAFGWHGATALEQPPLSLFWAIQQRLRWVLGALQGLRAMWVKPEYDAMGTRRKLRLSMAVYTRIATYALGFPIGLVGLVFLIRPLADPPNVGSPFFFVRIGLFLSALGWIVSYQIGIRRNLLYQRMPWYRQVVHHVGMLAVTPVVGLCETVGPFVALARWLIGARNAQWTPTPKLSERPAPVETLETLGAADVVEETPAPAPLQPAPMPAWLTALRSDARRTRRATPRGPLVTAGRSLVVAGLLAALFAGYEIGGSGWMYDRSQQSLLTDFKQELPTGQVASASTGASEGNPIALLKLPKLGLDSVVVEGSSPQDLKDGPGHLRGSPMPGEAGNVVLVGRRTTYGGPFRNLDHLSKGDSIDVTTADGTFTYTVSTVERTGGGKSDPLNGTFDNRLTLVTSDPAFFPDGRLSVVATLKGPPISVPDRARVPVSSAELGLAADPYGLGLALFWAVLIGAAIWATWRTRQLWPARVRHLFATPLLIALVLLLFASLDRLLPGTM